jgi:Tol biopolymer transport system component
MSRLVVALAFAFALTFAPTGAPQQPAPCVGRGKLVFSCSGCPQKPSGPSLYIVKANGTGFRRIETPRLSPYGPRWSPNGRRISLSSRFTDIWTIDPAGNSARRLTHACPECDYTPAAWSPDGKRLVFPRRSLLFTTGDAAALMVVRADGTHPRILYKQENLEINSSPAWSPDGRHIAFAIRHEFTQHGSRYDGHELMVSTLDGAQPRPIVIPELPPSAYSELYGLDWT